MSMIADRNQRTYLSMYMPGVSPRTTTYARPSDTMIDDVIVDGSDGVVVRGVSADRADPTARACTRE